MQIFPLIYFLQKCKKSLPNDTMPDNLSPYFYETKI